MLMRKRFPLMNEAGDGSVGGGAPGAGDGGQPGAGKGEGGGDPGAGGKPGDQPLIQQPDPYAWLDQKFRVNNAEGKLDLDASAKKLNESYGQLSKRLGTGDVPPVAPTDYKFDGGEKFKDVKLDDELSNAFRDRAHKLGLTTAQYQGVMEAHLEMVPAVLDSVLKLSTEQATAQLQQVWKSQAEFDAGIQAAQRAVNSLPQDLGQDVWARFGRDPAFLQVAAIFGKEMAEDKSASSATGGGSNQNAEQLMASEAYRNPKHPEHASVSAKVKAMFEAQHGTSTAFQ